MRRSHSRLAVILVLFAGAPDAWAQTPGTATGNIDGTVTDKTGAVLPGVTIVAAGDALMGRRPTTSGADGTFRLSGLPPGAYVLEFSLDKFKKKKVPLTIALGATTTVNVPLEEAAFIEAPIVVEGGVRTVDRHATTMGTGFTAQELMQLPGSRSSGAILWATPSLNFVRVDVGGSAPVGPFSAYGMNGMTVPTIEGIVVSGMDQLTLADYGAFAEVSVGTGAYGPEWPTPGVHIQILTKSGGNTYHGGLVATYEHRNWQAHNIDPGQEALDAAGSLEVPPREANRLWHWHDINGDVGGFIARDRAWWYTSVRHQRRSARQVLFPLEPIESTIISATAKGTVALTGRQRLIVYGQRGQNREPIRLGGFLLPMTAINTSRESTASQLGLSLVWKAEWNAALSNDLYAEVRAGQSDQSRADRPNGLSPRFEDRVTFQVFGGHRNWQEDRRNDQINGALSFVTETLGRHHLKLGGEVLRIVDGQHWNHGFPGDVLHVRQNGNPSQVYLFQTPSHSTSGIWMYEAYASDSWQVNGRFTLNLGVRFDRYRPFLPAQEHPAGRFNPSPQFYPARDTILTWNLFAPRLGASIDLGGDGRTILKLSYGRYWRTPATMLGFNVNPNTPDRWERYAWSDDNHDDVWEDGEQKAPLESRGGTAPATVDPGLRLAYVREVTARVEREIAGGLNVSTGFVWRGQRQQGARQAASWRYEDFSIIRKLQDPGLDLVSGTGDDGPDIEIHDLPLEKVGQSEVIIRNLSHGDTDYFTWELTARRRFRDHWSLMAWYSTTWSRDHASEYLGQAVRANEFPLTPNDFIQTDDQGRHRFRMWSARVLATYDARWGIRITPFVRHQSGQPFARTLATTLNDRTTIRVLAEPVGTRRQKNITLLDLQVEKDFVIRNGPRLTAYLDVFNALNANPEQQISWSNNTFLRPLAIVPPRIARVGFRVDW